MLNLLKRSEKINLPLSNTAESNFVSKKYVWWGKRKKYNMTSKLLVNLLQLLPSIKRFQINHYKWKPTISKRKDLKCVHSFYKWGLSAPKSVSSEYHFLLRQRFMYFSEYRLKSDSVYLTCLSCNFNIQPRLIYGVTCECIPHKHWRTKSYTFDITIVFIEIYWKNVIQIYTKQSPTRRFGFHIAFTWNIKYYIPDLI